MNAIDQRLRAAIRDTAEEITPDDIPPLRLPPGQPGRPGAAHAGGTPRWRLLAPLGAAAAVVVIVAAALALAGGLPRPAAGPGPAAVAGSVPPYYVALNVTGNLRCCRPGLPYFPPTDAVVRVTTTGAVLATITPPRPYGTFVGVSGAADDRTFVLAAQELAWLPLNVGKLPRTGFFLLRIDPANPVPGARARLTPLPVTLPAGVSGLALSPDGSKLAVSGDYAAWGLHVVAVASGAERVWAGDVTTFGPGAAGEPLSWAPDGRHVAFVSGGAAVRLLDTAAAGSSLLADSRLVVSGPQGDVFDYWRQVMITHGGQTIIAVIELAGGEQTGAPVRQELVTFSARTGGLLHVLNQIPVYGGYEQVLWASPSGQVLIVTGTQPGATAGVLRQGRFTPIPWSNRTAAAAW